MSLFQPVVIRPARHLLLVRFKKEVAWFQAAVLACLTFSWYLPMAAYYHTIDPRWFWWLLASVPVVLIACFYRQAIDLARRCVKGNDYVFDSAAGTVSHTGSPTVLFRNIDKVIFRTYLGESNGHQHETYSVALLLADGSKIQLTILEKEKPVADLASEIADFVGKRIEKVYATVWDHHGEPIKSLDLTQRQLDSEVNSSESKR